MFLPFLCYYCVNFENQLIVIVRIVLGGGSDLFEMDFNENLILNNVFGTLKSILKYLRNFDRI